MKDTAKTGRNSCPVEWTLEVIGGKWKCVILWHVRGRVRRFSELRRLIPGATQKMLTAQLRQLERDGLIERKVYAQVPPKVEYSDIRIWPLAFSSAGTNVQMGPVAHRRRLSASKSFVAANNHLRPLPCTRSRNSGKHLIEARSTAAHIGPWEPTRFRRKT